MNNKAKSNIFFIKMIMKKSFVLMLMLMISLTLVSCKSKNSDDELLEDEKEVVEEETNNEDYDIDEVISMYKPNELGDIPIIMYHAVLPIAPSVYQRSVEGFKKDLNYMYDNNYVTISNRDFIDFNIDIPAGKTPIILTFDDGEAGTFDLVKNDKGELSPRPDTAIYLMEEFYKEHPDFGKNAILFINGHAGTFNDKDSDKSITLEEKINWLFDHGYEVSNHTSGHLNIKQSSNSEIQKQIATVDKQIKEIKPDAKLDSIAYPFGAKPSSENEWTITNGSYDGYSYSYDIGYREGPSKPRFVPVISTNFEPLNTPRLRGNEGEAGDMWSYFESYEKQPSLRFISDGNKDIITVPEGKENEINKDKIANKTIVTYNKETLVRTGKESSNNANEEIKEENSDVKVKANVKTKTDVKVKTNVKVNTQSEALKEMPVLY